MVSNPEFNTIRIVVKITDYVFGTINVIPNPGCKPN